MWQEAVRKDALQRGKTQRAMSVEMEKKAAKREMFEKRLALRKRSHHAGCMFNRQPAVSGLNFRFDDSGKLRGEFECGKERQGYDGMVHGGVVAAIIDASMAQCLMGHDIVAYTADLSVRYRRPVTIDTPIVIITSVLQSRSEYLYMLESEICQNAELAVKATGKFVRPKLIAV